MSNRLVKKPTVAFATVGCRLNQAETEAIAEEFSNRDWQVLNFSDKADVYLVNTCTVTGRADRSSRQLIHQARRKHSDAFIIAAGCFAKRAADELIEDCEVDLVLGVEEKTKPFDYLPREKSESSAPQRRQSPLVFVDSTESETSVALGTKISGRSRAFLKVQDGCDHACAYCAVTLVRGNSRSASFDEILQAYRRIKQAGFNEVVITGVDISAWGSDIAGNKKDFVDLVAEAATMGIPRVRLSSLEPWELTPERIEKLASIDAWCEHLHISLQSADEDVLSSMRRSTGIQSIEESIEELLKQRPNATIGADLIAGFPGESESAFLKTLDFLKDGRLDYAHVFPFSARPGTPAAEMENKIPHEEIHNRAETLRIEARKQKRIHLEKNVGRIEEVLIEENKVSGYTRNYLRVELKGKTGLPRKLMNVKLMKLDPVKDLIYAEENDE